MKTVLVGINSSFVHTCLSVRELYSYARSKGLECSFCEHTVNNEPVKTTDSLYTEDADIYAFSVYIFNVAYVKRVASDLKKAKPDCFIVFGGPEVSHSREKFLKENPYVDLILSGEGEEAFCDLLRNFRADRPSVKNKEVFYQNKLKNFSYIYNGNYITFGDREPICDLSVLPFPYEPLEELRDRILYYESSRGCPFRCSYCLSAGDMPLRYAPLDKVFADLKIFLDAKARQVKFIDRTFNSDRRRALEIWKFLAENDNGVTNFHFEIAAWLLNDEAIEFLRTVRKDLFRFEIGIQSTNPETMKAICRPVPFSEIKKAVAALDGKNIALHTDLISGLPHETIETFENSFNDVYSLEGEDLQLGFLKILDGSPMSDERFGAVFSSEPPYEVISTPTMSYSDLAFLRKIAALIEIYHNSGICSFALTDSLNTLFGLTPYRFWAKFATFSSEKGFFDKPRAVADTFSNLYYYICTLCGEGIAQSLCAYDLYRHGRVGSFPSWLTSLPDKEALYDLLKDEDRIKHILPEEYHEAFFSENIKYWYKNSVLFAVKDLSEPNNKEVLYWSLYNKIRLQIKIDK
ncbi:MAG: DUF4080 domain-containing protein [Clostridia bacterium]|nr:DUF4080 domain-containing protein [Clostridia bacterium]